MFKPIKQKFKKHPILAFLEFLLPMGPGGRGRGGVRFLYNFRKKIFCIGKLFVGVIKEGEVYENSMINSC